MNLYKKLYYGLVLATMQSIYASIPNSIIDTITDTNMNGPYAVAITPNGTTAYVCNLNSSTVSIVDIATNTVTGTVSGSFSSPFAIAITPDGNTAYVCNYNPSSVSIICTNPLDTNYNIVTGTVTGSFNGPFAIAITPNGNTAYVCNQTASSVSIVDIETNIVTGIVDDSASNFNNPQAIAITPDGNTAYVCNSDGNNVSIICTDPLDANYNIVTGIVDDSASNFDSPYALAITPDGSTAYVVNYNGNNVSIVDLAINTTTGIVSDPDNILVTQQSIVISPDGTTCYTPILESNSIAIIDVNPLSYSYNSITGLIINTNINTAVGIAITPNGDYGYICSVNNNSVNVLYTNYNLPIQAPTNISLTTALLESFTASNYINKISWTPPTNGPIVAAYKIYRDAGLTQLVATVTATSKPSFAEYNLTANTLYNYYIVSVDNDGNLSAPLHGSITTLA